MDKKYEEDDKKKIVFTLQSQDKNKSVEYHKTQLLFVF